MVYVVCLRAYLNLEGTNISWIVKAGDVGVVGTAGLIGVLGSTGLSEYQLP